MRDILTLYNNNKNVTPESDSTTWKENEARLYICKECRLDDLDLHWERVIELGRYFPSCMEWDNIDGSDVEKVCCDKCEGRDYQVILWFKEFDKQNKDDMIEEVKEILSRPSETSRCKCTICLRKRHSTSGNSFRLKTYSEEIWTSMRKNIDHMNFEIPTPKKLSKEQCDYKPYEDSEDRVDVSLIMNENGWI